jgi:MoxR-like ATPase
MDGKEISEKFQEYRDKLERQRVEIRKRIIGLPEFIESLFICFYSQSQGKLGPHLLVEGKVGKGKTATLETFTRTISGATMSRIQFTPDLRPLDLIRLVEQREDRTLEFHPGPLFANLVLADEINRAHEKTRAALLEAMGEKQITIGRRTYPLEEPFFVMATENPIDTEGTFILGAAQLDRFMMKIYTESLSEEEEFSVSRMHQGKEPEIKEVVSKSEVLEIQEFIQNNIHVDPEITRDMIRIVRGLRPEAEIISPEDFYLLPEGERGYLFLERGAKVRAFLQGRRFVTLSDVAVIAFRVLNHRIGFRYTHGPGERVSKVRSLISQAMEKVIEEGAGGL